MHPFQVQSQPGILQIYWQMYKSHLSLLGEKFFKNVFARGSMSFFLNFKIQLLRISLSVRQVCGSILGQIKSDAVSPTPCYRSHVSS